MTAASVILYSLSLKTNTEKNKYNFGECFYMIKSIFFIFF
ncbi:hypothetical protein ECP03052602_3045 [Escherichia coli P0305260.2]|nr:hypothetical protein ECP03052602_3045 [Escherichia coli P0305260.2]